MYRKSPAIFRLFAEQTKQQLHYASILVALDGLSSALTEFKKEGGKGVNITLPFKHRAFSLVDSVSERAQRAEAINTIQFNEDGTLFGDNTDGVGLVRDILTNHKVSIKNKRILVLGAGRCRPRRIRRDYWRAGLQKLLYLIEQKIKPSH